MASRTATLLNFAQHRSPRYTSYPTAPHFHSGVTERVYGDWLDQLSADTPISLYVHIPYCRSLCWYCGCNTRATKSASPIETYVEYLLTEMALVADHLPPGVQVSHLALGGGTPAILSPRQLDLLMDALSDLFRFTVNAERAIEIDPRHFTRDDAQAIGRNGFTRASTGVQSFDPAVQRAINRIQPYEVVEAAFNRLRQAGVNKINADLLYGLPMQTEASARASAEAAAALDPDRLAVFGYAHVPHMKLNQRMIKTEDLPQAKARLAQADAMEDSLTGCGYRLIGIDHYAKPGDPMTRALETGTLRRNFQGYTTDRSPTMIALGASAIGRTPQGYVQNTSEVRTWMEDLDAARLPVGKGVALSRDDVMRGAIIEQIMTYLSVDPAAVAHAHNLPEPDVDLTELIEAEIVAVEQGRVIVNPAYRPLARLVAAAYDAYLSTGAAKHSVSV